MSFDPFTAALEIGEAAIDKIWVDADTREIEKRKLAELKQNGDMALLNAKVQLLLSQIEVNKIEAGSSSLFVSGWRPFIGWTGGAAMVYQFILYPILIWIWALLQANDVVPVTLSPPPMLDTDALWVILTGMLGIGTMRSFEKTKNIQNNRAE